MKRILVYYPPNKLGMSDLDKTDYSILSERVKNELNGKFPNFGNKVWLQGILSEISNPDCIYEFGYDNISEDYINQNYDCVLLPLANCFHTGWIQYMEKRSSYIEKIKIPVYVIACGVQAKSYDDLTDLVESVKEPATRFIKSVYNTGGEFALRGYFTAEFFERLGFRNAVVTGCPSIYQMGRNLKITNQKVPESQFRSAINGTFKLPIPDKDIKKSDFVCQDVYGKFLYDPDYFKENPIDFRRILKLIKRGDYAFVRALANRKIHLFADTQQWMSFYVENNISFSFGSRIHGTIMPILSGVPSLCYSCDARTREMVEFFDIPGIINTGKEKIKIQSLYDLYCMTDYGKFNAGFQKRFDAFEAFLIKCGIVSKINQENTFMKKNADGITFPKKSNEFYFDKIQKEIKKHGILFNGLNAWYGN